MAELKFATVIFCKEKKEYTVPIKHVFSGKKDQKCIKPKDLTDFDDTKIYYVHWSSCEAEDCSPKKNCCHRYQALIRSFGKTGKDAENHAKTAKRPKFPNPKTITTSGTSDSVVEDEEKKRKALNLKARVSVIIYLS